MTTTTKLSIALMAAFASIAAPALCRAEAEKASPTEAQKILDAYQTQADQLEQRAADELKALRAKTIAELTAMQNKYAADSKPDAAKAIAYQIERFKAGAANPADEPAPASPAAWRGRVGASYVVNVTGRALGSVWGSVWGSDVYTDDSDITTAAVHAGVLKAGETGPVRVTIVAPPGSYLGSRRNDVTTGNWGHWEGAFTVASPVKKMAEVGGDVAVLEVGGLFRAPVGEVKLYRVTGVNGTVWGDGPYTADSKLATAAVHAGVLKLGETGVVKVTIVPGQAKFPSGERNGIRTSAWGTYDKGFQVEKP